MLRYLTATSILVLTACGTVTETSTGKTSKPAPQVKVNEVKPTNTINGKPIKPSQQKTNHKSSTTEPEKQVN